jgi:hypothetical protein
MKRDYKQLAFENIPSRRVLTYSLQNKRTHISLDVKALISFCIFSYFFPGGGIGVLGLCNAFTLIVGSWQ